MTRPKRAEADEGFSVDPDMPSDEIDPEDEAELGPEDDESEDD